MKTRFQNWLSFQGRTLMNHALLAAMAYAALNLALGLLTPAHATPVFPEAGYQLVYDLPIPDSANYYTRRPNA